VHVLAGEHSVAAHIPPRATVHANFAHGRVLGEQREKEMTLHSAESNTHMPNRH
jgi:hypothetical protein